MSENSKIDINVVSLHQDILDRFWATYLPSVEKYPNLRTIVFHQNLKLPKKDNIISMPTQIKGTPWNTVLNKGIEMAKERDADVVGQLNDDIDFNMYWLDDCLPWLNSFAVVSPGYVQCSKDLDFLKRTSEKSFNFDGIVKYLYGACMLMDAKKIDVSMFDERYGWGCMDFDLILEMKKRGMKSGTLERVSVLHHGGASHSKDVKRWHTATTLDRTAFDTKWKVRRAYRHLVNNYVMNHAHFRRIENENK